MKVLDVGDMVGPRQRIVSLRWLKTRGWTATDSTGARYYQTGPGHGTQGPSFALGLQTTEGLAVWPPRPEDAPAPKRMAQTSAKKRQEIRESRPVVAAVFERDEGCVLRYSSTVWGPCFGELTPHHLHKSGQGGGYSRTNCVTLCEYHNGAVEDQPIRAKAWGLVVNHEVLATEARERRWLHGICFSGDGP